MSVRFANALMLAIATVLVAGCASQAPVPVEERVQSLLAPVTPAVVEVPPGYYLVKKGDNLLRISLDNGQDYRDVAAWNKLEDPNRINVGQLLRVVPPEGVAVARPVSPPPVPVATDGPRPLVVDVLKREPKGGTQPYSDAAFSRMKQGDGESPVKSGQTSGESKPADIKPAPTEKLPASTAVEGVDWAWPSDGKLIGTFNDASNKGVDLAGKVGDPVQAAGAGKIVYAGSGLRGYGNLVIIKHNPTYLSAYAHNSKVLVKEGQSVTKGMKIAEVGSSDADQPKLHFEIRKQGKPVDPLVFLPKR
ncbi:MAG TPA: peptidoglycan DD-metalloendopeptidase family protein [Rhodocyclaceae bacterium]|nr:peptidoglycan DD-metalloendopeptidase family protein [Rhodocyclaceae bacterium]